MADRFTIMYNGPRNTRHQLCELRTTEDGVQVSFENVNSCEPLYLGPMTLANVIEKLLRNGTLATFEVVPQPEGVPMFTGKGPFGGW